MFSNTNETLSVVAMDQYGVSMGVLTPHKNIDEAIHSFETSDDKKWCGGKGKSYLYAWLKVQILKEDAYFNKHPRKAKSSNERWTNFCDDCVNFAALSAVLYQQPIHLLHPSAYEEALKGAKVNASCGAMPTLLDNIPVLEQ